MKIGDKKPLEVGIMDYLLGIADLTGELMRLSINSVASGNHSLCFEICPFMRQLHLMFDSFEYMNDFELSKKITVMKQSLEKIERVCFTIQVRGSEYPRGILAPTFDEVPVEDEM